MEGFENKRVHAHGARAKAAGWPGDREGEGTQLGGMIVGSGSTVHYAYVEQVRGKATQLVSAALCCYLHG